MAKITFIEANGVAHIQDVEPGLSVMQGAVKNAIPGIDADCGGACSCATCHVYIDPEWADSLPEVSDMEKSMLEFANDATANSRLSCQIEITEALDGLIVRMPVSQH